MEPRTNRPLMAYQSLRKSKHQKAMKANIFHRDLPSFHVFTLQPRQTIKRYLLISYIGILSNRQFCFLKNMDHSGLPHKIYQISWPSDA